jgi:hypothetical protein
MPRLALRSLSSLLGVAALAALTSCTPTERNYEGAGGNGASSGGGMGGAGGGGPACAPATEDCDGDGVCENLLGDVDHCGQCNHPCPKAPNADASCQNGTCALACAKGYAECNQNPGDGCEDIQSDKLNCGACGHDCMGGACTAGVCEPVSLGAMGGQPLAVATFAGDVYWGTGNGEIFRVPQDGGAIESLYASGGTIQSIAITVNGLYFTNGNRVTLLKPGGGTTWSSISYPETNAVAADASYVAWTATGANIVRTANANGNNNSKVGDIENGPTSVALVGTTVYWSNSLGAEIRSAQVQGGLGAATIATTPAPHHLIADNDTLYWISGDTIYTLPAAGGGTAKSLAPSGTDVRGMAVDLKNLYWTLGGPGEVWRMPKDGSAPPERIAAGQAGPQGIAVGPKAIFWANSTGGMIMRLAK